MLGLRSVRLPYGFPKHSLYETPSRLAIPKRRSNPMPLQAGSGRGDEQILAPAGNIN